MIYVLAVTYLLGLLANVGVMYLAGVFVSSILEAQSAQTQELLQRIQAPEYATHDYSVAQAPAPMPQPLVQSLPYDDDNALRMSREDLAVFSDEG